MFEGRRGSAGTRGQGHLTLLLALLFSLCCQCPGCHVSSWGQELGRALVILWGCYGAQLLLRRPLPSRFPGTFVGTTEPASPPLSSTSPTTAAATMPVVPTVASLAPAGEVALCLEEVAPSTSGTRKARVLYDYEAADSSELALLADEVGLGP